LIRVTIVSPNHALRAGLREMLSDQPDIKVIREAVSLDDVNEQETEVLVLASVSSIGLAELKTESMGVLLLTNDPESGRILLNSNFNAWGLLSLEASSDELYAAICAVAEGLWVGAPTLARGLMRISRGAAFTSAESLIENLTAREKEILQWIAEGLANKQIALKLGISEHTVKFHLSSLYAKFNVSSRTEAVRRGLELGLISL
jgi:DNA-binding NarL/FixJ family response regulator